jgi:hypothetical protein
MKKTIRILLPALLFFLILQSCSQEEDSFNSAYLIGKWRSGTLYYKYTVDGSGATWDTSDDVTEDEAQPFTWVLLNSELTHIHILEFGAKLPKVYTVTELKPLSLKYQDSFGKTFSFNKVL